MKTYKLSHLSDHTLLSNLSTLVARDRVTTAEMLAHIAEVDTRKLYLPAGYPSMYAYCVGDFGMSEDSACKRIRAARTARQFPAIFEGVADGRLNLSAVVLLAPHMTEQTSDTLLSEAANKKNSEIEVLLARLYPRPDVPEMLSPVRPVPSATQQLPVVQVEPTPQLAPAPPELSAARRIEPSDPRPKIAPLAPQRYALQVTLNQNAHDMLREIQALLGHQVPSSNLSDILERVLSIAMTQLQKQKFAATGTPTAGGPTRHSRTREAGGLEARPRSMQLCQRQRPSMRGPRTARVRSCPGSRTRWPGDRSELATPLSRAQSVRCRVRLWNRVHESQTTGSSCGCGDMTRGLEEALMAYDEALATRIRKQLGKRKNLVEKKMFGGLAFLLSGNMCCGVSGDEMIVRLDPDETERALKKPHVRIFDMTGRPMKGWLLVGAAGIKTDTALAKWVETGVEYAGSLPAK